MSIPGEVAEADEIEEGDTISQRVRAINILARGNTAKLNMIDKLNNEASDDVSDDIQGTINEILIQN
jgi:hypothetical protein